MKNTPSVSYAVDEVLQDPQPASPFRQPSFDESTSKQRKIKFQLRLESNITMSLPYSQLGCLLTIDRKASLVQWMSKFTKRADRYVQGMRNHVNLGPKISETEKGKLSLSARIIQAGGVERVFRQVFYVEAEEKLVKASQYHLSTSAGPIVVMLFISTEKIAFHSDVLTTIRHPPTGDPRRMRMIWPIIGDGVGDDGGVLK